MAKSHRSFPREFKLQLVREVEGGSSSMAELSRRHEVHPNLIHKWVKQYRASGEEAFKHGTPGDGSAVDSKIAELEQTVGQLTMENRFLKKLLRRLENNSRIAPGGPR
jgi:transposase-like protein